MTVIGTVGLPGSGKGEAAAVARSVGIPVVTMGDVIREECRARGLDPATEHGTVATALREENGPAAIAERSLPLIRDRRTDHEVVLVDGIRSGVEVDAFEAAFGAEFVLLSIEAPFDLRRDRLADRGRDDAEAGESLADRDERELGFGMADAMDRADVVLENDGTLAEFRAAVETILTEGVEAYRERQG